MAAQESEVSKNVKAALEVDPRVDLHRFPISVESDGTSVRLSGDVENVAAKRVALSLARRVSGMQRVIDALRLVPVEPRGDGEIRDAFTRALQSQPELRNCTVRQWVKGRLETVQAPDDEEPSGRVEVAVVDGTITLRGSVISLSHKRMVETLAWWTRGCRDVVNAVELEPAEEDNDDEIADGVRLALEMDPFVHAEQLSIRSERGVVTLAGVLGRDDERRMAEMDAWTVWGVADVRNRIEIRTR